MLCNLKAVSSSSTTVTVSGTHSSSAPVRSIRQQGQLHLGQPQAELAAACCAGLRMLSPDPLSSARTGTGTGMMGVVGLTQAGMADRHPGPGRRDRDIVLRSQLHLAHFASLTPSWTDSASASAAADSESGISSRALGRAQRTTLHHSSHPGSTVGTPPGAAIHLNNQQVNHQQHGSTSHGTGTAGQYASGPQ